MKQSLTMTKRTALLMSLVCCACGTIGWDSAQTQSENSVTSLHYAQESTRTLVEIGVKSDPTFSVYTLNNPDRVIVEILGCDSSSHAAPIQVRNGVIDTAAVSVSQSNDYSTCRVILGLDREAEYTVDSSENAIVVAVKGEPSQSTEELAAAYETMKQSREDALSKARAIAAREQAQAADARAEAQARQTELSKLESEYAAAQQKLAALQAERDSALRTAQNAKQELAQQKQADTQTARAERMRLEADYQEAQQKLAALEAERDSALRIAQNTSAQKNTDLAKVQADLAKAQAKAQALESARNEAIVRAEMAESRLAQADSDAQQKIAYQQSLSANAQSDAQAARAELARLEADYQAAQQKLAAAEAERNEAQNAARNASAQNSNDLANAQAELAIARANTQAAEARLASAKAEAQQIIAKEQARSMAAKADAERANAQISRLEAENKAAAMRSAEVEQNYSKLAAQNSELLEKLAKQDKQMAQLQKDVLAGGAAREKLKKIEAESAKQSSLSAAQAKEQETLIADLKEQARQGRHALKDLQKLQAENSALRGQLESQHTVMAATTEGNANNPAQADIASTVPPIDYSAIASTAPLKKIAQNAPVDAHAAAQASIRDIHFRNNPNNDGMQVVVKLSAPVDKFESQDIGSQKTVLKIANAVVPDDFNKKFDTSAFRQGVKFVDTVQTKDGIELIAQSSSQTIDAVEQNGDTVIWNIRPLRTPASDVYRASVDRRHSAMLSAAEPNASSASSSAYGTSSLKNTPLAKRKITLDIHNADINDLLRLLSDEINTSIVVSPDVKGNVTLSLKSVPLDQAMDIILRMNDLGMRYEGNIIWVAKAAAFREEEERAIRAAEMREKLEPLEVRLIPVNYATASDLSSNVSSLLSSRGTVNIDERTNTLILKDVAANLDAAEILVSNLDTQTPQILIEARIVETQANFNKEIGIQWGGDGIASAATGNATGIVFPSTIGIAGGSSSDNNAGTSATPNFAVNLPAAVGTGSGGAIGLTLGSIGGAINLNIRLSALESKGFLKIISAPRIMTLDNIQASIESGTSIPISVVSAAGAQTVFYDAKLNLDVTPHVTRDGNVYLKINISKNEPDFGNTGANGDPSIIRKQAHTELLIPDGDTTVIGGIYTRNTSQSMQSVPFFGSIPILGYLFRTQAESDNRTELLIFITPRIINRDASISASGHGSFIPPVVSSDK